MSSNTPNISTTKENQPHLYPVKSVTREDKEEHVTEEKLETEENIGTKATDVIENEKETSNLSPEEQFVLKQIEKLVGGSLCTGLKRT